MPKLLFKEKKEYHLLLASTPYHQSKLSSGPVGHLSKLLDEKGELAFCLSFKRIAMDLAILLSTARSHIKKLEEEDIIKVDRFDADETPDGKKYEVYFLGTCIDDTEEWFTGQVVMKKSI